MIKQRTFLLSLLCLLALPIVAQDSTSIASVSRKAITGLASQLKTFPQEKIYLHFDKPYYATGERIWFRAHLVHSAIHIPYNLSRYVYVELVNGDNSVVGRKKLYPISNMYFGQMDLSAELPEGWYSLRAYTSHLRNVGEPYFFRRLVYIGNNLKEQKKAEASAKGRNHEDTFEVGFYPEGGHLTPGLRQKVAIRAVASDGLETEVSGRIVDQNNKEVAIFPLTANGLGLISFEPQTGSRYTAHCENKEGKQFSFPLPAVSASGIALSAYQNDTLLSVAFNTSDPSYTSDTLMLLVHQRGVPVYHTFFTPGQQALTISKKGLSDGVLQLVLYNRNMDVLSERQLFILGQDAVTVNVTTDKPSYRRRDRVKATIQLLDQKGNPIPGDFSLSVTDDADVVLKPDNETILSRILLQSEFEQSISRPNRFLNNGNAKTKDSLDLLMMTLPWNRYKVANVFKGQPSKGDVFPVERGGALSGQLLSYPARRPIPGNSVSLYIQRINHIDVQKTDKDGRFYFEGFEFPDSTSIMLNAEKGAGNFRDLLIDPDSFPAVKSVLPLSENVLVEAAMGRYMKRSREKYAQEKGLITIDLAEIEVVARKQQEKKMQQLRLDRGAAYFMPSKSFTSEKIQESNTLIDLLLTVAGVTLTQDGMGVLIRNATPLIMVDNIERDMNELTYIQPSEVELMDVLKDPTDLALYGSKGANGVISIFLKRGEQNAPKDQPKNHQAFVKPLGYCVPEVFPQPDYLKPEVRMNGIPDLRSTIYWHPAVVCNEEGMASVDFFLADNHGTCTLILEGVTPQGKPFRYQGKITVRP
jgi:TonB-dependent SusC/RagA subfamily outer membrane receptor